MPIRKPVVAGRFYEASASSCTAHIKQMLPKEPFPTDLPEKIIAGVVPHAGWMFSGELAAMVFAAVKQQQPVETFVLFGAVHSAMTARGMLYDSGQWQTPLGSITVDDNLAGSILDHADGLIIADCDSHSNEHSLEVQIPFIQHLFENAQIVPIMVPPVESAPKIGLAVADTLRQTPDKQVVCVASTDLTHYGPSYSCTPMGTGPDALQWAKDTNDRLFIDQALNMETEKLVESSRMYANACGAGAVAAAVAFARQFGVTQGTLLAHTTSAEVLQDKFNQSSSDSVGYAAIIFG